MEAYLLDWAELLLRWLHLIAGVAWIGASFYFVMLDCSLRPPQREEDRARGLFGELWAVHGGGIYHSEKYLAGPRDRALPERLHWSKWEAYTTGLSGFSLLVLIYWLGAESWLIDPSRMAFTPLQAVAASALVLAGGWLVYDLLCRWLDGRERVLALVLLLTAAASWGLFQVFQPRAAALHLGAMLGTIMVGNVFFHIIPGQRRMLAEIRAGMTPDPRHGCIGKQRSVHNTYFTLPVLLVMISNHYPMLWSHRQGWLSLFLLAFAGVLIRQFFVLRHSGRRLWRLPLLALLIIGGIMIWLRPSPPVASTESVPDGEALRILSARCAACHAARPSQPGFSQPPKGILLETTDQARMLAARIAQTVSSGYMPLGNLTGMTDDERARLLAWTRQRDGGGSP